MLSLLVAAALAALPLRAQEAAPAPLTLDQAYDLALKWSETLAQRGETVVQLQARQRELWSYVGPRLSVYGSELVQDVPRDLSGLSSSSADRDRHQAQLQLHQPLFTGLRDYLAIRQAKAQTASSEFALARARQLLYQDVAQAYLSLLSIRHQLEIQQSILQTTDDRLKELLQRERLGRSRRSEVLAAQSQRAQVMAQLETVRGAEAVAQLQMRFLTGLAGDAAPRELEAPAAEPLEPYLQASLRRPDVEGARRDRDAARYPVSIAARQRWPLVNLDGNYYLYRPIPQDRVKWDLTLSASLPLFTAGQIGAQTRQAEAAHRSAEAALVQSLRQAELDVRAAHRNLTSSLSIVTALVEAGRLAEANAKAQAEDYRAGLVTNLDVLGSITALQQTRLTLQAARIQALLARAQLGVAAGLPGGRP